MKKIFTLLMLSIFTVMNVNAAEEALWEGDWNVSWDLPDGDEHREWKGLGQEDFAAMEVGQKLYFYLTVTSDSYHKYNFDNWGWQALPGHEAEHAADFGFNADSKIEFIVTQDIKDAIATGGFAMHGHGYHVAKVTKEITNGDDPVTTETELWTGEWEVSWDFPDGNEHREWKGLGQEDFAAMEAGTKLFFYLNVTEATYHKYNFDNWGWEALPGHEAEHAADFGFNADCKIEFIVTQDIKDAIATGGFAMHGHGYKVMKVTKEETTTSINAVAAAQKNDSRYYNLAGQLVQNPTKGLYIVNGKKVLFK